MFHISERRKWYIGFGIVLLIILAFLALLHSEITMSIVIIALIIVAIYDVTQKKHTILRNFPILGHMRFILEFFRPEIQQYFVATDQSERPFDRQTRSLVYQRAKGIEDTLPFGTERNINQPGYEWVLHSLAPIHPKDVNPKIQIGNHQCTKPYISSRLNISAMSYGALSKNAIMALNKGAKLGGFCHNTGEGGLTEFHRQGGDICLQIGTGYFGFRTKDGHFDAEKFAIQAQYDDIKMIEIKLSQGAKPAHGGVLPKEKLTPEIAKIRDVPMGEDVLSPPAHTAFSTPVELCQFVQKLRELSGGKPIGFKLCIGRKTEFFAICKAMLKTQIFPDFITIDGAEGGTGAAPEEYVNHIGVPLEDALAFVHNALVGCGIREHICIIASGKTATGFDMVKRIALGADVINSARAMMLSLGCIQSKQCNRNTCPTGVATQNPRLYKALDIDDKKQRVYRFHDATVKSFTELVGAMGLKNPSELSASRVIRRIDEKTVQSLDEVYQYLKKGSLLDDTNLPIQYAKYWQQALADQF
ncbi:FMN-binding glutamate synthase family protein [Cysteiniphilum sp. 6C5]|uniref:FMN-binding glutamate synthase family protein n=1 Tax=unclassified Cysteiniphilum TaxID=2610889 RepID=UPI003F879FAE